MIKIFFLLFIAFYVFPKTNINIYYLDDSEDLIYHDKNNLMSGFYPELLNFIFNKNEYELIYKVYNDAEGLLQDIKYDVIPDNSIFLDIIPAPYMENNFLFSKDFLKFENYYLLKKANKEVFKNEYKFLANSQNSVFLEKNSVYENYIKEYDLPIKFNYLKQANKIDLNFLNNNLKNSELDNKSEKSDAILLSKYNMFSIIKDNQDYIYFKSLYVGRVALAFKKLSLDFDIKSRKNGLDRQSKILELRKLVNDRLEILLKHRIIKELIFKHKIYLDEI